MLHNPILDKAAHNTSHNTHGEVPIEEEAESTSIENLRAILSEAAAAAKDIKAKTQASIIDADVVAESIITDISALGNTAQIAAKATQTARLQTQNTNNKVLEAGGGLDAQTKLTRQLNEEGERLAVLLDEKTDIVNDEFTGIGLIDSIINGFRSVSVDQEIASVSAERDNTARQVSNITSSQESFARVNAINEKTLNEAVIENNLKGIAITSSLEASKVKLSNIHSNASLLASLAAADRTLVSNAKDLYALDSEEHRLNLQAAADKRLKSKELTDAEITVNIQNGRFGMGLPEESDELVIRKFSDPITAEAYHKLQELGNVVDPLGFTSGASFATAMDNFKLIDPDNTALPVRLSPVVNKIHRNLVEDFAKRPGGAPRDKKLLDAALNEVAAATMIEFEKEITKGSPLEAPPMSIIQKNRSIIDTPFYQKVLKEKNMVETDPQLIVDAALAGMDAGDITPEEAAAGIEAIFDAAALHNNTFQGGFRRVGLPNQKSYNVFLKNPLGILDRLGIGIGTLFLGSPLSIALVEAKKDPANLLGRDIPVDLMDPNSIQLFLARIRMTEPLQNEGE